MSVAANFTIDEYHKIVDSGAFVGLQKRIELFRGELRMMSPQGIQHAEVVSHLSDWSYDVVDRTRAQIRIQLPIEIAGLNSELEPDIVWVHAKRYTRHPQPEEILLLIEVAEHSLSYDLTQKRDMYAEAGIRDYWVVDIPSRTVHVLRAARQGCFREHLQLSGTDSVSPLSMAEISCSAKDLFSCLNV